MLKFQVFKEDYGWLGLSQGFNPGQDWARNEGAQMVP